MIDINVAYPWSKGYDGTGVVIAVLDDGIDYKNKDLIENYDETASYDFIDYDNDPMPEKSHLDTSHGTKCAGIIASSKNRFCGVGVAFNSSIGGIRMLNLKTTDSIEASALSYQSNYIDIYSCNWGPKDDGMRFGKPGPLALKALRIGATKGRRSLGSIYVWSSGNGESRGDDCNTDGYVTNIYTIAIGAILGNGSQTSYGESCASMMAVTVSGNSIINSSDDIFITTDIDDRCVESFPGTSSAASIATGIIALMLQSNPLLTWRDVQHLIVETSLITNPTDPRWMRNGAGKWFNPVFGFGRLDASSLVDRAYHWENVPTQKKCRGKSKSGPWPITLGSSLLLTDNITKCYENGEPIEDISIQKLEHVQLVISITHVCRGRLTIQLISPSGTRSVLLKPRQKDSSSHGIHEWVFTSLHLWGEDPKGTWSIVVTDINNPAICNVEKNYNHISKIFKAKSRSNSNSDKKEEEQNHSMIERIVVEKYRLLQDDRGVEDNKPSTQFGI
ncbi:hypothetical protein HZS_2518 [Henneguya salminicola]|nr:hypothetical protein HZS_2518 [Henneguya salminicola]